MTQVLFKQVRLIDPAQGRDEIGDLLVDGGVIQRLAPHLAAPAGADIQPPQGWIIGPGLVDLYSRSGEPGHEQRETLASLAAAAAAGGFSRVALLPLSQPAIDNAAQLAQQRSRSQDLASPVQFYFWAALSQGARGEQMSELLELAAAGAAGFCDGRPLTDLALVHQLLDYLQPTGLPLALWPRDPGLAAGGVAREGPWTLRQGLPPDPELSETVPLAGLIELARSRGRSIHCMRLSTARGVELLTQAKAAGVALTASVSWMHLLFNSSDLGGYEPSLRLAPPLGNPTDQAALIEAVRCGVIDAIAIDHSPYSYEEKTVAFGLAPPGAIGLELALPLLWQRFVASGQWPALTLWDRLSQSPARCLHQAPPQLAPGQQEWLLFAPQQPWQANPDQLCSQASNSPYLGKEIIGKVLQLHANGRQ
jgi:dihydroorotase